MIKTNPSQKENEKIIEIKDLTFTYGCHPVLEEINLTIARGDAVGITGPNGAGKTTLLNLIMGRLKPQRGRITIFGSGLEKFKDHSRISYVPQKATFFNPSFPASVREVVVSGLTPKKGLLRLLNASDYREADRVLEMVGLAGIGHRLLSGLSGGQQQRVLIARALAARPEVIIMDEPTVGLDTSSQQEIISLLKALNRDNGVTLLIVSHDIEWLSNVITKKICLNMHVCSCQQKHNFALAPGTCLGFRPSY
jgi:zinc transport system ATP-binding protein